MGLSSLLVAVAALGLGLFGALRCIAGQPAVGFVAMGAAAVALRLTPRVWSAPTPTMAKGASDRLGLFAVVAALCFFRFYRMQPPGLWGDDALNGLLAFDVVDGAIGSPFEIIQHSHSRFHALTNFIIAGSYEVFGADLLALRIPGIVASCLTGLIVYGIARRLFGQPVAVIAGLFFASSPMQIAHAKSLPQVILGLSLQAAGVYALVRAIQDRSARWLIAAAIPLASTIYTYHAAKVAVLVVLPLLVAAARERALGRRAYAAAALVFGACLIPAAISYWHEPTAFLGRAREVTILDEIRKAGSAWPLVPSVARTLGVFHVEQGPEYNWFGPGDDPALTPIMGSLVLHGLLASLLGWRQPRHQLLLFWFALGLAPAAFSTEAPRGYRTLMATPPLFVWAALPLAALWRAAGHTIARRAAQALVVAMIGASLTFDYYYYFHRTYTHPRSRWTLGERIVDMARLTRARGPGWTAYIMSPTFTAEHESLRLLARMWDLDIRDAPSIHFALFGAALPKQGAIYLTAPGSHYAATILRQQLPQTEDAPRFDPASEMWPWGGSWPYETVPPRREPVVAGVIAPRQSLMTYRSSDKRLPVEVMCEGETGNPRWREPVPYYRFFGDTFAEPLRCKWRGAVHIPPGDRRELHVLAEPSVFVEVDGAAYEPPRPLDPGPHQVEISTSAAAKRITLEVGWKNPGGGVEVVPYRAWRRASLPAAPVGRSD